MYLQNVYFQNAYRLYNPRPNPHPEANPTLCTYKTRAHTLQICEYVFCKYIAVGLASG